MSRYLARARGYNYFPPPQADAVSWCWGAGAILEHGGRLFPTAPGPRAREQYAEAGAAQSGTPSDSITSCSSLAC